MHSNMATSFEVDKTMVFKFEWNIRFNLEQSRGNSRAHIESTNIAETIDAIEILTQKCHRSCAECRWNRPVVETKVM